MLARRHSIRQGTILADQRRRWASMVPPCDQHPPLSIQQADGELLPCCDGLPSLQALHCCFAEQANGHGGARCTQDQPCRAGQPAHKGATLAGSSGLALWQVLHHYRRTRAGPPFRALRGAAHLQTAPPPSQSTARSSGRPGQCSWGWPAGQPGWPAVRPALPRRLRRLQ